jgi:DNA polymerase-3 subunit beta
MELNVNRKTFLETLTGVGSVAAKTSTLPILENVKISVREDGTMVVTAFDLEVSAMRKFKFSESASAYEFCVNPRDLIAVLKTLRDDDITLVVDDSNCVVKHAKGEMSFGILPAIDFPEIGKDDNPTKVTIEAETLFDWLKNGVKFAGNDKLRPIINGVYLYVDGTEIGVASSDSQKLFTDNMRADITGAINVGGTLGTKAVAPLLDMINGADKVVVYFGEKMLSFRTDKAMLSCLKPVGKFPNVKGLIGRKENPIRVTIDKADLIDSVSRAIMTAKVETCLLRLVAEGNTMRVNSEDLLFNKKTNEECACVVEGGSIEVGLKGSNLLDCLNAIESGDVVFEFTSPRHSVNLYDGSNPNRVIMAMPLCLVG